MATMTKNNKPNVRLLAAVYFAFFAVLFTLVVKYFLFILKMGSLLPFFSCLILSLLLGAFFGGLFGLRLAKPDSTGKIFGWGMLFAVVIIPFYSLGLQIIYYFHNHTMYNNLHQWQDYFVLYGVLVVFFTLVAGIWLIPLSGFAALHFNRHILPGYNTYLNKQRNN